jgi:hypothetical protein
MKGNIKMEDYDGFQWIKQHRTKILPLRWFANWCEFIAHYHLIKVLRLDHVKDYGSAYKYHSFISNLFYKPYFRWGTVYELLTDIDSVES